MNCLFRDQHIVGFEGLQIGLAADSCGRIAKSWANAVEVKGVTPAAMPVDASAYQTTTTQFHKGRSLIVR
jgi:hypothetical protein